MPFCLYSLLTPVIERAEIMFEKTRPLLVLANEIGAHLKSKKETIAVAESSSGGLISAAPLSVPGASSYFLGGGVIYTREARRALLGFSENEVSMRAATEEYAALVAETIRDQLGATWGLGETGASGPTGNSYGDPAGHTAMAAVGPENKSAILETGSDNRESNMLRFAEGTLQLLRSLLNS